MQKDRRGENFNIDYKIQKSKGFEKVILFNVVENKKARVGGGTE